jgi:hypothetical protein
VNRNPVLYTGFLPSLATGLVLACLLLGWCISSFGFLTLPNNLLLTKIIKQLINYVFSIVHYCLPTFGQVFGHTLEQIRRFGLEEVVEPILELCVVVE